jgi:ferredoxin-NADP reductase
VPLQTGDVARPAPLLGRLLRAALSSVLPAVSTLTTPLLPDDYLGLVDPLLALDDLRARVVEVRPEAAGATTLVLRPGLGWTGHRAGQWVRLGVELDGVTHSRCYSLTAPPRPDGRLLVTVAPVPGGRVSPHLARQVAVGDVLRLSPAEGDFVLPAVLPDRLLLVSAGSGLTPVIGLLRELAARGPLPDTVLVHSARRPQDVLFAADLAALAAEHPRLRLVLRHTALEGRLTAAALAAAVPDLALRAAWACGPAGLLDELERYWAAAGLALRTERFAPPRHAGTAGEGGTATYARAGAVAEVPGGTSLLDAGEAAGVLLPSGCRMGICFSCVVPLRAGRVRDLRSGAVSGEPGDLVQTCVHEPCGDVVLDA